MANNNFQNEVRDFLVNRFPVAYRIDDAAYNRYGGRQVSQKPFDFFGATRRGKMWGAEAKRILTNSFPTKNLSSHQRDNLTKLVLNGCNAWLFINWRYGNRGGEAIWIDYFNFLQVQQNIEEQFNRVSLKPVDFDEKWFLEKTVGGWYITKKHPLRYL